MSCVCGFRDLLFTWHIFKESFVKVDPQVSHWVYDLLLDKHYAKFKCTTAQFKIKCLW